MSQDIPDQLTILFDGYCGMCTRSINAVLRWDREHRLKAVACQAIDGGAAYGLSEEDCGASVWVVTPDGRNVAGAQAAMLIAAVLLRRSWPVRAGRLPGIRQALAMGYELIARNRHRFPGVTPWCEAHPGSCFGTPSSCGVDDRSACGVG